MPKQQIKVVTLNDFTGGLNLRADAFQLANNESPDMMNVDVDPRGGFRQRKAVAPFGGSFTGGDPLSLWSFETPSYKQVMIRQGSVVKYSTGGAWSNAVASGLTAGLPIRCATFKNNGYLQNGTDAPWRWTGVTATQLGTAFNENLQAPSGGNMPKAKLIAVWQGCVWLANTTESAVAYPNRVRWSHPNFPEDYRSIDFADIDTGVDGDEITALVPFGDRLLVFKRNSIHAVYGYGPDNFQVLPVHHSSGAVSADAVVATDEGVYYFSWPNGLMHYDGRHEPRWLFERLFPAITGGSIPDAYQAKVTVGWLNRRVFVSVPWGSSTSNARTFVFDPSVGKDGAWVQYDLGLGSMLLWRPPAADALPLAVVVGKSYLVRLDVDAAFDDFGSGATHIASYYRTRWLDFGQPAVRKRWRRPEIVMMGGTTAKILVDARTDYDASLVRHSFYLDTTADANTFMWDDPSHGWDSGAVWARASSDINELRRGSSMGTSRAISMQFSGPLSNASWGIDSVSLKFTLKPVRS